MNTVICVAAGLSSRMGAFKPLLPLGDQTIIRTLIMRYRSCGIDQVILVTGHNADQLEEHVRDLGVLCRRNIRYAVSDMFESVKLGVHAYLAEGKEPSSDDRIFVTPSDIPLVKKSTVTTLLTAVGEACIPTTYGRKGHPLCLARHLLDDILSYTGNEGLQGALRALDVNLTTVPVDDPGILVDADTPDDYARLQQLFVEIYE